MAEKKDTKERFYLGNKNLPSGDSEFEYTASQMKEMKKCMNNILYFAENYFFIVNLDTGRQKIKLHKYQKRMLRSMRDNRMVIMNASRQIGKTTIMTIYALWLMCFFEDQRVLVVANKEKTAIEIFKRIRMAYEQVPNFLKPSIHDSYGKTGMNLTNGSEVQISTTSSDAGRGLSCNCLLLDEMAHIDAHIVDDYWASVYPIISSSQKAKIFISSTPNSTGNKFHELYTGATAGTNGWKAETIYWYDVPGRTEKWKEQRIREMGSLEMFMQEFECVFLDDGDSVINMDLKEKLTITVQEPILHVDDGKYKIWETYSEFNTYAIGVDVGEGVNEASSCVQVLNITDLTHITQAACYTCNTISPPKFSKKVHEIALNWGSPPLAIERNNCGGTVIDNMHNLEGYNNIINLAPGKHKGKNYERMGVISHVNTKYKGIVNMRYWLNDLMCISLRDQKTVDELDTFIRKPNGTWGHRKGEGVRDDRVLALVWALIILEETLVEKHFEVVKWDDYHKPLEIIPLNYGINNYVDPSSMYSDDKIVGENGNTPPMIMSGDFCTMADMDIAQLESQGWSRVE